LLELFELFELLVMFKVAINSRNGDRRQAGRQAGGVDPSLIQPTIQPSIRHSFCGIYVIYAIYANLNHHSPLPSGP